MEELSHYVNGKRTNGTSGRFADVYNPATGDVQARVPLASKAELDAAAGSSHPMRAGLARPQPPRT